MAQGFTKDDLIVLADLAAALKATFNYLEHPAFMNNIGQVQVTLGSTTVTISGTVAVSTMGAGLQDQTFSYPTLNNLEFTQWINNIVI